MTDTENTITLNDIWVQLCGFNILRSELYELKKRFYESNAKEMKYLKELTELKSRITDLEDRNKRMEVRMENVESRSRKMNIVLYNIEESELESTTTIRDKVLGIIRNVIGLKDFSEKDLKSVYRVGSRKPASLRPVVVIFWEYEKKRLIISSLQKLRGTGIGVQEDFTYETRQIRKSLKDYVSKAREAGFKAYLKRNKIVINAQCYTLEEIRCNIENILDKKSLSELDYCPYSNDVYANTQADSKCENTEEMKILLAMDAKLTRFNSLYSNAELIKSTDSHQAEKEKDSDCVLHVYKGSMFTKMLEEQEEQSDNEEQS